MTRAVHTSMPEADYFASPALSCSGAKLLRDEARNHVDRAAGRAPA